MQALSFRDDYRLGGYRSSNRFTVRVPCDLVTSRTDSNGDQAKPMVAFDHAFVCSSRGMATDCLQLHRHCSLGFWWNGNFGTWRWIVLYFVSGVTGEIAGYAWQPMGAGASVAGAGLLGAFAVWLILENRAPQAMTGAVFVLVGAAILTLVRDLHGPPIMIGACMGWAMLKTRNAKRVPTT